MLVPERRALQIIYECVMSARKREILQDLTIRSVVDVVGGVPGPAGSRGGGALGG